MADTADTIKVAIGNLLHLACPLAIPVVSAFDSSASRKRSANCKAFLSFNLPNLEACAELLGIKLADADELKIFTKATLVPRLVDAIESLLPAQCLECSMSYVVDLNPADPPLSHCFKCFQGSHNCDVSKAKHQALVELCLPAGFIWLCHQCFSDNNPIRHRNSKTRHNSVSKNNSTLSHSIS